MNIHRIIQILPEEPESLLVIATEIERGVFNGNTVTLMLTNEFQNVGGYSYIPLVDGLPRGVFIVYEFTTYTKNTSSVFSDSLRTCIPVISPFIRIK